jgi:transposase
MDVIVERPAALDVHKEQVTACVRVADGHGGRVSHVAEFKTTVRGLLVLRDWLKAHRVTQITMEATGVYWKPIWHVLEDEFELMLVNARHVKQVRVARPMCPTRRGCANSPRPDFCVRASCRPNRFVRCAC